MRLNSFHGDEQKAESMNLKRAMGGIPSRGVYIEIDESEEHQMKAINRS